MLKTGLAQLVEHWSPKPGVGSSSLSTRANKIFYMKKFFKRIANYIKESYNELVHKVSWPTRKELSSSTIVVMTASIIMALVLWGIDSGFEFLVKGFYRIIFN